MSYEFDELSNVSYKLIISVFSLLNYFHNSSLIIHNFLHSFALASFFASDFIFSFAVIRNSTRRFWLLPSSVVVAIFWCSFTKTFCDNSVGGYAFFTQITCN